MSIRYGRTRAAVVAVQRLARASAALTVCMLVQTQMAFAQTPTPLGVEDALRRAIAADPRLDGARAQLDASKAGRLQARVRHNPTLEVEAESFGGDGQTRGYDSAETTVRLSQQIEFGGRRQARQRLADKDVQGAEIDARIAMLDVLRDVQRAYYAAAAAEAHAVIANEQAVQADEVKRAVDQRVAVARDPLMAGASAAARAAEARLSKARADQDTSIADVTLASLLGAAEAEGFALDFSIGKHAHGNDAPDVERARRSVERAQAALRLERTQTWRDPTISVGMRRFEASSDTGLVAGFSVPLGLFDRNAGGIAKATAEERRALAAVQAAERALEREKLALERRLAVLRISVEGMERDVIPQAERALALARQGYRQGGFSYLDVFEAQRSLSAARVTRVDTLLAYHDADAALDRLTGRFTALAEEALK